MSSTECVEKLKVLADSTRLAVMSELFLGPQHVNNLARLLSVEQSLLSHHLRVLREAGLVVANRVGKGVEYSLPASMTQLTKDNTINLGCCALSFTTAGKKN